VTVERLESPPADLPEAEAEAEAEPEEPEPALAP